MTCPACSGRGYDFYAPDGEGEVESRPCSVCQETGSIPDYISVIGVTGTSEMVDLFETLVRAANEKAVKEGL